MRRAAGFDEPLGGSVSICNFILIFGLKGRLCQPRPKAWDRVPGHIFFRP
jgi:hypothetical protein